MYRTGKAVSGVVGILLKVLVSFIFIFPFFWIMSLALQSDAETTSLPITLIPKALNFINFQRAWNMAPFGTYLRNSVTIILSVISIQTVVMVPAAYAFAKFNFRGKNLLFGILLIAFMMPSQVNFLPVYYMMADWKLMNTLLPQILPDMTNAFGIFLLRQYFMQVPDELIEAAKLDNASELQLLGRIMLPMSKPGISAIVLLSFVGKWNSYFWPLVMTQSENVRPLTIGVMKLKAGAEGTVEWNTIMAGNLFLVLPMLLIYLFASKYIISSFAYSGIK